MSTTNRLAHAPPQRSDFNSSAVIRGSSSAGLLRIGKSRLVDSRTANAGLVFRPMTQEAAYLICSDCSYLCMGFMESPDGLDFITSIGFVASAAGMETMPSTILRCSGIRTLAASPTARIMAMR
jgi:hypothetical protein